MRSRLAIACLLPLVLLTKALPAWGQGMLINGNRTVAGAFNYCMTVGPLNDYTCTLNPAITALRDGQCFLFKAHVANTGAATLNVNGLGAKPLKKWVTGVLSELTASDIGAGQEVHACWDASANQTMQVLSLGSGTGGGGGSGISGATTNGLVYALTPTTATSMPALTTGQLAIGRTGLPPLPGVLTGTPNQISVTLGPGTIALAIPTNSVLPGTTSGDFSGSFSGVFSGTASTATALASDPPGCTTNQFVTDLSATGAPTCAQASFSMLAGLAGSAQLPNPTPTAGGRVQAKSCAGLGHVEAINTDSTVTCTADAGAAGGLGDPGVSGLVVRTGPSATVARLLQGTGSNISVTNGSGVTGDPTIDLVSTGVTAGSCTNCNLSYDAKGRLTAAADGTGGTGTVTIAGSPGLGQTTEWASGTSIQGVANTGTGLAVRQTNPILVGPTLGIASATSLNKLTLTPPATGATFTLTDAKTLTVQNTLTLAGTDGSTVNVGPGGNVVYAPTTLGVNLPVLGTGGPQLTTGTRAGTTTEFATVTGAKTTNRQVGFDASGNLIASGADLGAGLTTGTAGQTTYYSAPTTLAPSTALRMSSTDVVSIKPLVTDLVNANLLLDQHHIVRCTAGTSDRTLTLPPAGTTTVGYYYIFKKDIGAGACNVVGAGSDTINGSPLPVSAGTQWSFIEVRLESSASPGNWYATVGIADPFATRPQTSAYQVTRDDFDGFKTLTVAAGTFPITLVPSAQQPAKGKFIHVVNYGVGVVTIARNGQNLNGGTASLTLPAASATAPTSAWIVSTGVDYVAALSGAGGGGVTDATYVTTTAHAGLSNEVVIPSLQKSWVHLPVQAAKLPQTNAARIDNSTHLTRLLFDNATSQCATWQFLMPPDYGTSPQIRLEYTMTSAIIGTLNFDISVASNIITPTYATANACNDAGVPGTAGTKDEILCVLSTPGGLLASETQIIRVCRNTSGSATGDAGVIGLLLEYQKQ